MADDPLDDYLACLAAARKSRPMSGSARESISHELMNAIAEAISEAQQRPG